MKDFFVAYWKEIAEIAVFVIVSIFGMLISKGKKVLPILEKIYGQLPSMISRVESIYGAGNGNVKKAAVLEACDALLFKLSGVHLKDSEYYYSLIDEQIEKILSTPSRKEKNEK